MAGLCVKSKGFFACLRVCMYATHVFASYKFLKNLENFSINFEMCVDDLIKDK